jgi:hypothetical protein
LIKKGEIFMQFKETVVWFLHKWWIRTHHPTLQVLGTLYTSLKP